MGRKTSPFSMMADCADMRMTLSPTGSSVNAPTAKVLDEGGAGAPILDQNRWLTAGSVPPVIHLDHLSLERWELEAFADHIEQRIEQPPRQSRPSNRKLRRLGRGVPRNHDLIGVVPIESIPVDHVAAGWHR